MALESYGKPSFSLILPFQSLISANRYDLFDPIHSSISMIHVSISLVLIPFKLFLTFMLEFLKVESIKFIKILKNQNFVGLKR